jgi:hypothetical protein
VGGKPFKTTRQRLSLMVRALLLHAVPDAQAKTVAATPDLRSLTKTIGSGDVYPQRQTLG